MNRHYVAYHRRLDHGPLIDEDPFRVWTRKKVTHLPDAWVWMIEGIVGPPRQYVLGSVFRVERIQEGTAPSFHQAWGMGRAFLPPVPLDPFPWFSLLLKATSRFSLGLALIKDPIVIAGLTTLGNPD